MNKLSRMDRIQLLGALIALTLIGSLKNKWGEWRTKSPTFRWLTDDWSPKTEKRLTWLAAILLILSIAGPLCYSTVWPGAN